MKKEILEELARKDKQIYNLKKDNEILRNAYKKIKELAQTNAYDSTTNLQNQMKSVVDICEHQLHFWLKSMYKHF